MSYIHYNDQELFLEDVALQQIAKEFGTPCYVYSQQIITQNWQAYYEPLQQSKRPFKIHYAVKANSNLSILSLLAKLGAGFDVVSSGEIQRVLAAGGKPNDIIFSGVGKTAAEINLALDLQIYSIHVESEAELLRINDLAGKKNTLIDIAIRINPDIAANTHAYISTGTKENKFGIEYSKAVEIYLLAKSLPNIRIKGIACHIGSQITTLTPFLNAIDQLQLIINQLREHQINLEYIDIGGGLGISYNDEEPPTPQEYINAVIAKLKNSNLELHIEPGRSIVASSGILLTKVEYLKQNAQSNFAIVDAAMNDLLRPALYQSYHTILPVMLASNQDATKRFSVVGPICESGDFIAINRMLKLNSGDLLAIKDCGAYGFSMSSNYNTRPRCAEILVNVNKMQLIRRRETINQLLENEIFTNE